MSRAVGPSHLSGLHGKEVKIIDLYDRGYSIQQIIDETGFNANTVRKTVSRFAGLFDAEDRKWKNDLRNASSRLLTAIRAVHGRHVA